MEILTSNIGSLQATFSSHPVLFGSLVLWSLIWKGFGLWKSARLSHKGWFVAIFLINTVGLLEMGYLYFVARNYNVLTEETDKKES